MNPDEHTLADELHTCVMDLARVHHITDQLCDILQHLESPHHELQPSNVIISPGDDVWVRHGSRAAREPWAAPETLRDGTLTVLSNVYSVGKMLDAMLANRPDLPDQARSLVMQCTTTDPNKRTRSFETLRMLLGAIRWSGLRRAHGAWYRRFEPKDDRERTLVESLRKAPGDDAMRGVYADWLEENGDNERATFLRRDAGGLPEDTSWRAIVARSPIVGCDHKDCLARWSALRVIDSIDNCRACGRCKRTIAYCTSVEDAENHGRRRAAFVLDAAVDQDEAKRAFQRALIPVAMPTYNPPPPPPPPPIGTLPLPDNPPPPNYGGADVPTERNALARFFGWLRRR